MRTYLEHANLTVPDVDAAIEFLKVVDPHMTIMHDGYHEKGYRWAHVGIGDCYIALEEPHDGTGSTSNRRPYRDYGINHLGWVVDDLEGVIRRLEERGFKKGIPGENHRFRRRVYYHDSADFEWELIQYHTTSQEERFSYE